MKKTNPETKFSLAIGEDDMISVSVHGEPAELSSMLFQAMQKNNTIAAMILGSTHAYLDSIGVDPSELFDMAKDARKLFPDSMMN